MNDDDLSRPTIKNTDVVHYRDGHSTYFNTDLLITDLGRSKDVELYGFWVRLIMSHEVTPEGLLVTEQLREDLAGDRFDLLLGRLEEFGAVERNGDRIAFPNLVWGTPPADDEQE